MSKTLENDCIEVVRNASLCEGCPWAVELLKDAHSCDTELENANGRLLNWREQASINSFVGVTQYRIGQLGLMGQLNNQRPCSGLKSFDYGDEIRQFLAEIGNNSFETTGKQCELRLRCDDHTSGWSKDI